MATSTTDCEAVLGEHFYGFGRWDAPYWFIGPEQGQSKDENNELDLRCRAFRQLERDGLCDCREFHKHVALPTTLKWYRDRGARAGVPLQSTWRRLMRTRFAHAGEPFSNDDLRAYQANHLGRHAGETCLVELCGLPAHSFAVSRDRDTYIDTRLERLVEKLSEHRPKFVVIYGKKYRQRWMDKLRELNPDMGADGIWQVGLIRIGFIDTRRGQPDDEWDELGRSLRSA